MDDIPPFERRNLHSSEDRGDAYELFVLEALASEGEAPRLKRYEGRGPDGAIDLISESAGPRCVVECKAFGEDRQGKPREDWVTVRRRLRNNLIFENGRFAGRAQYAPWADRDVPIDQYWFCTSGLFANPNDETTLREEITEFFRDEIGQRPGFEHLRELTVVTRDWSDFAEILRGDPPLRFRWFRDALPRGLRRLDSGLISSGFRSFLRGTRLPYYS